MPADPGKGSDARTADQRTADAHKTTNAQLYASFTPSSAHGRVRAMITDSGETVDEAPPSMPVQVLGLTSVPGAGDNFLVVDDDRMARQIADKREARQRAALLAKTTRR